ncbi:hypothetical protein Lalb_Chr09g0328801 [Lupinus albus]|uniref:Uncharacterized protein n=1 Tax=Lupinus albus TaxID=3870 RepID=A0A6A4Q0U2_LUPAL|nr:hypothetical protein Lalb_Chr09g0328801 [Lupinus albus]
MVYCIIAGFKLMKVRIAGCRRSMIDSDADALVTSSFWCRWLGHAFTLVQMT